MKKILLLFVAMTFSFGVYAQERQMPEKTHLMMQDGKMWIMKDGQSSAMDADLTLNEGTVVASTGKVTRKDESTRMLTDGEAIDMDGVITKHQVTKREKSKMK
jgi:hypothetical protein